MFRLFHWFFSSVKLRTRFALFSIFLTALIVLGTSYATLYGLKAMILREIQANHATVLENLKKVCEESQISRDLIFASEYIKSMDKSVRGFSYAIFVDLKRGLIFGRNDVFGEIMGDGETIIKRARVSGPKRIYTLSSGRKVIGYSTDVNLSEGKVGTAYLGYFEDIVEENIQESIGKIKIIVSYVSLVAFVIGLMISLLFAVQLTRPIKKLAEGAQALGEGRLDTQIDISGKDEIGLLASEFNEMAVKLKDLDALKDSFVSSVSHELRSPLTAISGYIELLLIKPVNKLDPAKVKKALDNIQESTNRLTNFINDVLDVAKIKAGKMEIRRSLSDMRRITESVFSFMNPLFSKKKIEAVLQLPDSIPKAPIDEEKIRQVITNLLSNAIKFTPEGGKITLSALGPQNSDRFITVFVRDSGIGIPEKYQKLIFQRFQQVPGVKQKVASVKGTGLGLAIVKGIVEAHGGEVGFESREGQGTTFFFKLPLDAETGVQTVQAGALV